MEKIIIGCVGKPSAGKSTFLNAATDATAKVGNYPFTTIEPNIGVSYYPTECPCKRFGKTDLCAPKYGRCENGTRWVPVKVLDVAGLIPGAHEGKGLGNKFLDDLRQAHILLHIVDVSGTTNEKGEVTTGYDPFFDIEWLEFEIHAWIFGNLWEKWGSVVRKHMINKSTCVNTFSKMLSGYGARQNQVQAALDKLGVKEPCDLTTWDEEMVKRFVTAFLAERFPTILVLNKADHPDADKNIAKICQSYSEDRIVLCSAVAEFFLRKIAKQGFIKYDAGNDDFVTATEDATLGLKALDEKMERRLENMRDMVLFRHGSTGVIEALTKAVEYREPVMVYPVKNIHNFTNNKTPQVFREGFMVAKGTTVRELARMLSPSLDRFFGYAEGVDGCRVAEDEVLTSKNNIIKICINEVEESKAGASAPAAAKK